MRGDQYLKYIKRLADTWRSGWELSEKVFAREMSALALTQSCIPLITPNNVTSPPARVGAKHCMYVSPCTC